MADLYLLANVVHDDTALYSQFLHAQANVILRPPGALWWVRRNGVFQLADVGVRENPSWLESLTRTRDGSVWTPGVI